MSSSLHVVGNEAKPEAVDAGPLLTISEMAVRMVKESMAAENLTGHALRVGVVGGGCSGFNYQLDFDDTRNDDDITWTVHGLEVRVDAMSATYLKGVHVDYASQGLQSGFKFTNPNASKTCGCGTSFSP